ncbi:MAG: putative molybdenum carrier protein [Longimicrobiales bacterium]
MIEKIIAGGQTGVDRAALDAALSHGLQHGGWCPRGRMAEDGRIPARYRLLETDSKDYAARTERNVLDSDGTLVLNSGTLDGGTQFTLELAKAHRKPWLIIDLDAAFDTPAVIRWLDRNRIRVLNIAGPRESKRPGIYARARAALDRIIEASGSSASG